MAKDLSFMKMPEKAEDEMMMDEELASGDSEMSESGMDLSAVTDEELMRECEKRGMSVEAKKEEAEEGEEEDDFEMPAGMEEESEEEESEEE